MLNSVGVSIYLQETREKNERYLIKSFEKGIDYVFTSLNIPEGSHDNLLHELEYFIELSNKHDVKLIADVSPSVINRFGLNSLEDLIDVGLKSIRIDYGYSNEEIVELSKRMEIILNASTLTKAQLEDFAKTGLKFEQVIACHNYYPKELTGLSIPDVKELNEMFRSYGVRSMSFVPGHDKRGPIFSGLPTIEDHRDIQLMEALFSSKFEVMADIVMIGDHGLTDFEWLQFEHYKNNIVLLRATLDADNQNIYYRTLHDRRDSSPYVVRTVESRQKELKSDNVEPKNCIERKFGSICLSNIHYGRYCGEIEISRKDLSQDDRVNVIGNVLKDDLSLIRFIKKGQSFKLIES